MKKKRRKKTSRTNDKKWNEPKNDSVNKQRLIEKKNYLVMEEVGKRNGQVSGFFFRNER